MAIEDDEPKCREVWSNVARFWYNKAADKSPNIGRLYHHLAILARPFTLKQLSLYTRSLTCVTPFESTKGSVMTLFNPILNGKKSANRRSSLFEPIFIRAYGILFTKGHDDPTDGFDEAIKELEANGLFDNYIVKVAARFAAVSNIAALFEYGNANRRISAPVNTKQPDPAFPEPLEESCRPLPEDYVMRGQLYSQWYFPETWFTDTMVGDDERSSEVPLMSQPWMDRLLWLDRSLSSVCLSLPIKELLLINFQLSLCLGYTNYPFRVRKQLALMSKTATRKMLSVKSSLLVPFIASLLPIASGNPIGNPGKVDPTSSIAPSVPLLSESIYFLFAAAAVVTAHFLAAKKDPIRVWACMMGISAYGWWAVGNDATALRSLSIT